MPTNASTNWRSATATSTFLYRFQNFYCLFLSQQFNISSAINSVGVPWGYSCRNSVATLRAIRLSLAMGEDGKRYALPSCLMMFLILLFMTFTSSFVNWRTFYSSKNSMSSVFRKKNTKNRRNFIISSIFCVFYYLVATVVMDIL